ncbi:DUF5129 domain-containing protein [Pseudarthrobacter phenanthrenivorans]|uniref:DUF5129 domain-containing protein n=1 Tax=Pseudarthrobacter phenanthrenivorans TaxID=361575 RepID=A0A3B0FRE5_PSEPS|nr:DUF5129 domain-containing protein [Pseudarthrobacter phenanthrenivorans]RKO24161.1 DUF5129 domain-containing protein [Pseudarthrobacter phenanthrenivorans]
MGSMMRRIGSLLLALLVLLPGTAAVAFAVAPVSVEIQDTAGVLDRNTLVPALERIEFYEPTRVVVYTYNGRTEDNLNEEVLRFARAEHPEWISADGQKWADGLFIFALDPVGRHVGTYMGEDRKVSLEQRNEIQDAAKDLLRDAQWTDGTIAGVQRAAELINQPWYRSAAFLVTAWVTAGTAALGAGAWVVVRAVTRSSARKEIERGDRSYANVSMDLEVTELNAGTIPEASRYGSTVLEKHRTFLNRYNAASELSNKVHALSKREFGRRRNLKFAREYAEAASELDALDDVIADTNALLNRADAWPAAWDRQLAPFRNDLAGLEQLLSKRHGQGDSASAAALRSFRDQSLREIERWTAELAEGKITPEKALDRLYEARTRLAVLLENHAETVIEGYAKNEREAALMRKEMEAAQDGLDHRRRTYEPSILGTVYPSYHFFSVATFNSGLNTGVSSVSSARGGGGSTTGYGSSGGSFSGSGSSSSF